MTTNARFFQNLVMAVLIASLLPLAATAEVPGPGSYGDPTLSGEQAVSRLRANGTYGSLMRAVTEAQSETGQAGGQSFISQTAKVFGENIPESRFGNSISVSGDTAVVGAFLEKVNGETFHGAAYVFVRNGNTWTRQARLLADDGTVDDRFGSSVAIWNDTIVIGAMGVDLFPVPQRPNQGAAYVFVRNAGVWTQQAKLAVFIEEIGNLGVSVDISGDTVIAGTLENVDGRQEQGSAYIFTRSGDAWTQQAKLLAADGAVVNRFGWSVAIENDTAIIGAYKNRVGNNPEQGAAYVFVRNGNAWTQQAKLAAADGVQFENFGWSVGLSGDTAIVGVFYGDGPFTAQGSAYVFVRNGSAWTQQAKLLAADGLPYEHFGWSVIVSGDLAVVGARHANLNSSLNAEGAAYTFTRSGGIWTQTTKFFAADAARLNGFGSSIAISGNTVVVGADSGNVGSNPHQGSAYVFAVNALRTPFDFDGDGRADISVFRPSDRVWYLNQTTAGFSARQFGLSSDKLAPADYDGDGKTDIAVYRGSGEWYISGSLNPQLRTETFGLAEDVPVPADFDGDQKAEIAVFRPSTGTWYRHQSTNNQTVAIQFGQSGDLPMKVDFDDDGKTDIAVFRPSSGSGIGSGARIIRCVLPRSVKMAISP